MGQGDYTLGIDVGDETVVAAVCPVEGDARRARALEPARSPDDAGPDPAPAPGHARRRIGATAPMYLAGRPVDPAAVVAQLARQVTERATAAEGATPAWTVLTVPPSWGAHRRDLLAVALRASGLTQVSLESTAAAVLRRHRGAGSVPEGAPVVVVDVGARSVDTAVLRATAEDVVTLAVPPAPLAWGGRDVDDAVVQLVGDCLAAEEDGSTADPAAFKRACVAAKEALSTDSVACVELPGADGPIALRLVREDLEELIAEPLQGLVAVVRRAVAEAGLEVADLAAVVLAGGTAAVPLVAETLSAELDRPVVVDAEPALTAALGAAERAAELSTTAEQPAEEQPAAALEPDVDDDAAAVAALPAVAGAARAPRAARAARRPGTPPVASRPPTRSGSRPPVPTTDLHGRRHAVRVGVVLSAFLAIVVGVAAAVSTDWAATTGQQAVAGTAAPQQTGAAAQPDDADDGDDGGIGLSPAAAEGRADEQDRDRANSSTKPVSSTGATTSRSGSSSAATGSTAGTTSGARPPGNTSAGSPDSSGPGTQDASTSPQTGGSSSSGGPGTTPPPTGQPSTDPPVSTPPVSTPPPSTSNPPEPEPTQVSEPPVTTPPPVAEPEPTAATEEPPPAGTPAAGDAAVPGQP